MTDDADHRSDAADPGQVGARSAGALYEITSIRRIEATWLAATAPGVLMARAAAAVADEATRRLRRLPPATTVWLLVGPGNNGGDALLAGARLRADGFAVEAFAVAPVCAGAATSADAAMARRAWLDGGGTLAPLESALARLVTAESGEPADGGTCSPDQASSPDQAGSPQQSIPSLPMIPPQQAPAPRSPRLPPLLAIDGLFGIGLSRPLAPMLAELAGALARQRVPVVAIDVPSGLDADRGAAVGDGAVISAVATVTMLGDKPGLHTGAGLRHAGVVRVAPLREVDPATGTDPAALPDTVRPEATRSDTAQPAAARSEVTRLDAARPDAVLLTPERIAALLPPRRADAHKGDAGDVLVLGGRLGMAGAARLAARGALAAGAGRIWIATEAATGAATGAAANAADRQTPIDPLRPELMRWRFDRRDTGRWPGRAPVLVIGCGLGHDPTALAWLTAACGSEALLVCDADALNLLAGRPALTRDRAGATIVTPHPLEAARLLATSTAAIEHDRIGGAIAIARRYRAVAVLKGAGTVVADPAGHYAINTSGNPLLATGGTGDLLAGIIGALAAAASRRQALAAAAAAAACAGVWLHGAAADRLAARHGSTGIPAGRIAAAVPATLRALQAGALRG